jgi:uncharacterized protein (DUF2225 family)
MTTDFRPYAGGFQPLSFALLICPVCGYTARSHRFGDPVPDGMKEFVRGSITPFLPRRDVLAETKYEIAAKIAEFSSNSSLVIADLLLRAAWCAGDRKRGCMEEIEFRKRAITWFVRALDDPVTLEEQRFRAMYLCGEEYRRIGDLTESGRWFRLLIAYCQEQKGGHSWARLAEQQLEHPRDRFEKDEYFPKILLFDVEERR